MAHPPSPRHCQDLTLASPVLDRAVLVMVADSPEAILVLAHHHGFRRVQPYLPPAERERGVRLFQESGLFVLLPWADAPGQAPTNPDLYVWEPSAAVTGVAGGSGQQHTMSHPPSGDFLLAGGLEATNLRSLVQALPEGARSRMRGVDAASRLEAAPGQKDALKVSAFIHTAHELEFA